MAEGAPLLREYRVKNLIEGSNPSLSARYAKRPAWGVLRIWRREVVDEPSGSTDSPGANRDSRRLAPQRAARRGSAHGWAEQSPRAIMQPDAPSKGRFAYLAEREVVDEPSGSTDSPGANRDSRRLAPQRAARRGSAHGWAEQSPRAIMQPDAPSKGRFAYLAERGADEPSGDSALPPPRPSGQRLRRCSLWRPASASDKFVWNEFGQPQAGPVARSAKG